MDIVKGLQPKAYSRNGNFENIKNCTEVVYILNIKGIVSRRNFRLNLITFKRLSEKLIIRIFEYSNSAEIDVEENLEKKN